MKEQIEPLERLITHFNKLPGIGRKSAARLAFFLLQHPDEEAMELAQAIVDLKKNVRHCSECFNITSQNPCAICANEKRDRQTICVVENPSDLLAIESTGEYRGLYHVLMGAISPIAGIGPEDLTTPRLLGRLKDESITEVIIATNPTNDGEATAIYLTRLLTPLGITISRIAQGLPVGSNLEHADSVTMARSISTRRIIS